ncbi:MAG: hypothetical protein JSW45_12800 [Thiotrichales bacterium]|nr:MAG: hypothetical protein JSW45_12800 [Thiotrichales bacterium]
MEKMHAHQNRVLRYLLQAINYTVFMALIWYFATSPSVRILADDEAVITMAFAHAGDLREPCRKLSYEELAKLPPNMRKPEECPRERSPVAIEMVLDGETIYSRSLNPPGLYQDGGVDVYYSKKIPAGKHYFEIKMNDSVRVDGFNHTHEQEINVEPAQILLVDFDSEKGFIIQ